VPIYYPFPHLGGILLTQIAEQHPPTGTNGLANARQLLKAFDDEKEATRELDRSKDDLLVYHTGKENI
jgi:hypothetical protein